MDLCIWLAAKLSKTFPKKMEECCSFMSRIFRRLSEETGIQRKGDDWELLGLMRGPSLKNPMCIYYLLNDSTWDQTSRLGVLLESN